MLNFQSEREHTFSWPTRSSPPARRCVNIIGRYLSDKPMPYAKKKRISSDYRCKDCAWWKEYGMVCTYTFTHAGDLAKVCKHFKKK